MGIRLLSADLLSSRHSSHFGLPFPHLKNTMADVEQQNVVAPAEEEEAKKVETPEKAEAESTETVDEEEKEEEEEEKAEEKAEETPVAVVSPQKRPIEEVVEKEESPLKKPKIDENEEAAVTEEAAA